MSIGEIDLANPQAIVCAILPRRELYPRGVWYLPCMGHLTKHTDELVKRVRRIAGQVQALEKALAASEDCAQILHLAAAARGAMNGLMEEIVEDHLQEHVVRRGLTEIQRSEGAEEVMQAIRRYGR